MPLSPSLLDTRFDAPFDAIIVGGSYAGLSAALQLARARRSVCVIDAGSPRNRFAAAAHGFFGQDGMAPYAMIEQARNKVLAYPSIHFVSGSVASAEALASGGFAVQLADGSALSASKLVLAYGLTDILPDLPGLTERWGKTALHCPYCHGYEFAGQALGVLNVAEVSSHQAILISDWGPTTFFLNGKNELEDATRSKLAQRNVRLETTPVVAIAGEADAPAQVILADGRSVVVGALFLGARIRMNSSIAADLGCEFDTGPFGDVIRTDAMKQTTVPGVYVAGDIARFAASATFAAADGTMAGVAVHQSLVFG